MELRQCVSEAATWWLSLGAGDAAHLSHANLSDDRPARPIAGADRIAVIAACDDGRLLGMDRGAETSELILCELGGCKTALRVPLAGGAQIAATLTSSAGPVAATITNDAAPIRYRLMSMLRSLLGTRGTPRHQGWPTRSLGAQYAVLPAVALPADSRWAAFAVDTQLLG